MSSVAVSQSNNPYLLTLPELMSAKKKIGVAAACYDRHKNSMKGFDSHALNPSEFRSQLRFNFLIELTNAELGAIIMFFDKDGDGTVDTVEFMNEFFRLGKQELIKESLHRKHKEKLIAERNAKIEKDKAEKVEALLRTRTTDVYTEEDKVSAIEKISKVAFTYDHTKPSLREFAKCGYVTGTEFQQIMKRNFLISFTAAEMAAVMNLFGAEKSGKLDTKLFIRHFFRMGRAERDHHNTLHKKITNQKHENLRQHALAAQERYGKMVEAKMLPATEADMISAERKIRLAAACFKKDMAFRVPIDKCFETSVLTPTNFKDIMKTNFDVNLTPGELDAAMKMFDADGDGTISCVEFLSTFFRMGSLEKSKLIKKHQILTEKLQAEKEERERRKIEEIESLKATTVVWPKLPPPDPVYEEALGLSSTVDESMRSSTPGGLPSINGSSKERSPNRVLRKPSVLDTVSPNRHLDKFLRKNKSLADIFPKASQQTKDFIREIEEEERRIHKLKITTAETKKRIKNNAKKAAERRNTQFAERTSPVPEEYMNIYESDGEWGSMGSNLPSDPPNFADENPFGDESRGILPRITGPSTDRGDSRGGSRSGVSRVPTVACKHVANEDLNSSGDEIYYDDSEFVNNSGIEEVEDD